MREYFTKALVLDQKNAGEYDKRIILFTEEMGKVSAKAKSARKITSKLSGHLQPGNLVQARLVEKNGLQIVDALKISKLDFELADLYSLDNILADNEPDPRLWHLLSAGKFNWPQILTILGWDPREAICHLCSAGEPAAFSIFGQEFFCAPCSLKLSQKELLYMNARH